MTAPRHRLVRTGLVLAVTLLAILGLLVLAGAPPGKTLAVMAVGSFGSTTAWLRTLSAAVPMLLCAAGLCLTFAANLWNIGVEGQIIMGAVTGLWLLRTWGGALPPWLALCLSLVAAACGGAAWGFLSGWLRVRGRVHEIFSGLGLNFVALGVSLWLILGPWKRPGIASLSGTEPLPDALRLPTLPGCPMSPVGLLLAVAAFGLCWWIARRTFFGLALAAVRQNPAAAARLGLAPDKRLLAAMALGGALAGLAGGLLVVGLYHRLVPSISGTFGYTAILAVLMAGLDVRLVPLTCLFFAALIVGAVQLPLQLSLDSSLAGVVQGVLVLAILALRRTNAAAGPREDA